MTSPYIDQAVAWAALPIKVIVRPVKRVQVSKMVATVFNDVEIQVIGPEFSDWYERMVPYLATAAYTALRRRLLSEGKKS